MIDQMTKIVRDIEDLCGERNIDPPKSITLSFNTRRDMEHFRYKYTIAGLGLINEHRDHTRHFVRGMEVLLDVHGVS